MLFYFLKKSMKQRLNKLCYLHELFEDWIMCKLYNKTSAHTLKDREPVIFTKSVSFFCEKNGIFIVEFIRNI